MERSRLIAGAVATAAVIMAAALAASVTCTPSAPSARAPTRAASSTASCRERLAPAEPPLPPAPSVPPPPSLAQLDIRLPRAFLDRQVEGQVPRSLASASGRSAGAAGKVSYSVTRGDFSWSLEHGDLVARTPVTVSLSICKPLFGSLCPVYGSCSPQLGVEARTATSLDAHYRPAQPRVKIAMKSGCSVVGVDVSSRVQSIAQANVARIEKRIAAALPAPELWLEQVLALATVVPLSAGRCLRLQPKSATQLPAELDDEALSLHFQVGASVAVAADCAPPTPTPMAPPLTSATEPQSPTEVVLAAAWGTAELGEALKSVLVGRVLGEGAVGAAGSSASLIETVEVRTAQPDAAGAAPLLLLSLQLQGATCGQLWVATRPTLRDGRLGLALDDALPVGADLAATVARELDAVALPLPEAASELVAILEAAASSLAAATTDRSVAVTLAPADTRVEALPAGNELLLLVRRAALVTITPTPNP